MIIMSSLLGLDEMTVGAVSAFPTVDAVSAPGKFQDCVPLGSQTDTFLPWDQE